MTHRLGLGVSFPVALRSLLFLRFDLLTSDVLLLLTQIQVLLLHFSSCTPSPHTFPFRYILVLDSPLLICQCIRLAHLTWIHCARSTSFPWREVTAFSKSSAVVPNAISCVSHSLCPRHLSMLRFSRTYIISSFSTYRPLSFSQPQVLWC